MVKFGSVASVAICNESSYRFGMLRFLTPFLWVFVTLVFSLDAVAQPCDLRMQVKSEQTPVSGMPCHDGMMNGETPKNNEAPEHHKDACCCAALLKNVINFEGADLKQPHPGIVIWASPINDSADSIPFEYDPPPPRA
ncbi:MAG: hypothetical protein QNI84_07690 [Henriciella sp.]|nr:hypothetical protein [Henriciella sp.]